MNKTTFFCIFILLTVIGCNKEPGLGGRATLQGTIYERHFNSINDPAPTTYPASNKSVYIIYGADVTYSDKQTTGPEGNYEFNGLKKGDYTIYAYSDDSIFPTQPQISIEQNVTITEKKQVIDVPKIITYKY